MQLILPSNLECGLAPGAPGLHAGIVAGLTHDYTPNHILTVVRWREGKVESDGGMKRETGEPREKLSQRPLRRPRNSRGANGDRTRAASIGDKRFSRNTTNKRYIVPVSKHAYITYITFHKKIGFRKYKNREKKLD